MKKLNKEIKRVFDIIKYQEKLSIHLKGVHKKLKGKRLNLKKMESKINASAEYLEQLERKPLWSLFVKILGDNEEELERERQVYLLAILKHQGCQKSIKSLEFEIDVLSQQQKGTSRENRLLNNLVSKKLFELKKKNPKIAKKILRIESKTNEFRCQKQELKEAISVGKKALAYMERLAKAFSEIEEWGNFEEASRLTSKHKKQIKTSKSLILKSNRYLGKLEEELYDITHHHKLDYIQFVNTFSDFLEDIYDGLISDWVIQKRIKNSINTLLTGKDKILRILGMLDLDFQKTDHLILEKKKELKDLIITSK